MHADIAATFHDHGRIGEVTSPFWPLSGLRLTTPGLELRWPGPDDLEQLAGLAADGVHDPDVMPFAVPWTDAPPGERARNVLQYFWRTWAAWTPGDWTLDLAVLRDGVVVGTQGMTGRQFAVRREVSTGSWVGRRYHGQGIGTQMRAAVLHLAFEGLAAEYATSEAFEDNPASHAISRRLGYADDGIERIVVREKPVISRRFRLDRPGWLAHRRIPVEIEGLAACLADFGLAAGSDMMSSQ
jgi:RimJ/RimL family protein N-acetyltransferase